MDICQTCLNLKEIEYYDKEPWVDCIQLHRLNQEQQKKFMWQAVDECPFYTSCNGCNKEE